MFTQLEPTQLRLPSCVDTIENHAVGESSAMTLGCLGERIDLQELISSFIAVLLPASGNLAAYA